MTPHLKSRLTLPHGFFTRQGGVSEGDYASLNAGPGSGDDLARVAENRSRVAQALGARMLLTAKQVHSPLCVTLTEPWEMLAPPEGDAIATTLRGVAVGVLTADCSPVLFEDAQAGVIAAAHAGWKGAIGGVLEAAVAAMEALGASPARIRACIGPMIAQPSYEVGAEFLARFVQEDAADAALFTPSPRAGHHHFDFPSYIEKRLLRLGLAQVENLRRDTCADEARFFSYRRNTLRGIPAYGRQVSAIALPASH